MIWYDELSKSERINDIKYDIVPYTSGRGLHVGCGIFKPFTHFIGVDDFEINDKRVEPRDAYGLRICQNIRSDPSLLPMIASKSMDFVVSSGMLTRVKHVKRSLAEWWRVIVDGGHLVLQSSPRKPENPLQIREISPAELIVAMKETGRWDLVESDTKDETFWQVYRKRVVGHEFSYAKEKPAKRLCIVRYGGIGDMLMVSNLLPGLKRQGWHITLMTTAGRGYPVMKHDPNVDEFILQDNHQVHNDELPLHWAVWEKKFDRFLNLSESVEGAFLMLPGKPQMSWPKHLRDEYLSTNYIEFAHRLACVPFEIESKFYPTDREKRKAAKFKKHLNSKMLIWAVDGSSIHKHWPFMDNAIARILVNCSDWKIVTVGNQMSSLLEAGWENEPRVVKKCGKLSVRQTLALAQVADMVVGPETGVLNAVGFEDVPKIIFMSHSAPSNLVKHWKNVQVLEPEGTPCYPCHMIHYGFEFCRRDSVEVKVGDNVLIAEGAHCQTHITVDKFWESFRILQRLM